MPSKSPTARSLDLCRDLGWTAGVVERWCGPAKKRIDLFGCIDVVALDFTVTYIETDPLSGYVYTRSGIVGIQCCAASGHAAHVTKAKAEPRLKLWLEAGGRYEVWSWHKYAKPKDGKWWRVRREAITLADLD